MTSPVIGEPAPDVLGGDWVARTITLTAGACAQHAEHNPPTTSGAVAEYSCAEQPVATIVHRRERQHARAVLYVHGYVDYFFQTHHASTWDNAGFDFYAIDLRDYGRSIRPGRHPNWITDLATYDEEISAALRWLRTTYPEVILAGHSTGGLITTLYAHDHPGAIDALVLNSPWFELNENWFTRMVLSPAIRLVAAFSPNLPIDDLGSAYGRALHISTGGEWDYNLAWKPLEGFGITAGWFRAIRRGHSRIRRGLAIKVPILLATSASRGDNSHPTAAECDSTDVVLSPPQMWKRVRRIGRDVTIIKIAGGRHDLTLSMLPARTQFAAQLTAWLQDHFPPAR